MATAISPGASVYYNKDTLSNKAYNERLPAIMDFYDGEKYVGTFKFEDGQLVFEGEIEESAKILFQQFRTYVDNYIKDETLKFTLDSTLEYIK